MVNKEEAELAQLEQELDNLKSLESSQADYGSPNPEKKDSMFKFFREILHLPESWKVGNLNDKEIGNHGLSVRSNLDLALYAESEGLDTLADYFIGKANNVAAPTMGRKGFMPQLFVTSIKKEQKLAAPTQQKSSWFGGNKDGQQPSAE